MNRRPEAQTEVMTHFAITFHGYDRAQVDAFVKKTNEALESNDPNRHASATADAQAVTFRVTLRGYDRKDVDHYLRRIARGRSQDRA